MRPTSIAIASIVLAGTALVVPSTSSAAPGHCFDSRGRAIGSVYDTETPDTRFVTWVQARGGECRALRADEVALHRNRAAAYPPDYRSARREPAPAAPAPRTVTWDGDPAVAQRLVVTHYRAQQPNLVVTDTGRVAQLSNGDYARIYETVYSDGTRREVAVQLRSGRQYVMMERIDGTAWSPSIDLDYDE